MQSVILGFCLITAAVCLPQNPTPYMPRAPAPGPCPRVPVVTNFNVHAYLGRWYEIERFFNPFQNGDCVTADYALLNNGSISVANSDVEAGKLNTIFGVASPLPNSSEAKLIVEFPGNSFTQRGVPNYNVVATDYKNYAVVYTCASFNGNKLEFSWILARKPMIPPGFLRDLKEWLLKVNVDSARYEPTLQDPSCPRRQI